MSHYLVDFVLTTKKPVLELFLYGFCSPLVVSLIGALLREFPDRWSFYLWLLFGELYSLMFSLDWNSEARLQFQEFLSLNGHQLEQRAALSGLGEEKWLVPGWSRILTRGPCTVLASPKMGSRLALTEMSRVFETTSGEELVELQAQNERGLFCISGSCCARMKAVEPVRRKPNATVVVSSFHPTAHCCGPLLRIRRSVCSIWEKR
ncbi:hypothetical protein F2P79_009903 [Pimephales promelas]|nr:hypothetical protein F2P79_009903 [Pimephales promelas]